jgi:hypothetical protein
VPLSFRPEEIVHDANFVSVMGAFKRWRDDRSGASEMNVIATQLQNEFPKSNSNRNISVEPLHLNFVTESTRRNLCFCSAQSGFCC